jgi:hypothetical protein
VNGQLHAPEALPPGKTLGTYWTGGWVGPQSRSGRGGEKLLIVPGLELRPLCRPARSQSLYRLRYPGP